MKILYHHRIASKDGQYVHVEEIIKALRSQGHEIIVVAPSVAENSDFGSGGGWVSKPKQRLPKGLYELLEFSYSFYAFWKLCLAIIKHKPDAIYERYNLFMPAGIWAKKLFRLPLQLEVNSPLYDERNRYGGVSLAALAQWSERYTWCNADRVLPVTEVLAGYVRKSGVPEQQICVIHNGIDPAIFHGHRDSGRSEEFSNKLVIGFVGFCREWHRLDEVMALLAKQQDPRLFFLIVGDGPVASELTDQARRLGLEQHFKVTGLVARQDMPYWLDQIDIALQPAVTPWASPLKLIEYLGKETAIVAPDTDNIKELLVDGDNALLFDHQDIGSMMDPIQRLIDDPQLMTRLKQRAGRTIVEKQLTWSANAQRIAAGFEQAECTPE